jgi:hypothetical protein
MFVMMVMMMMMMISLVLQSMAGGVMSQVQGIIPGMRRGEEEVPDPAPQEEYQEYQVIHQYPSVPGVTGNTSVPGVPGVPGNTSVPGVPGNTSLPVPGVPGNTSVQVPGVPCNTSVLVPGVSGNKYISSSTMFTS